MNCFARRRANCVGRTLPVLQPLSAGSQTMHGPQEMRAVMQKDFEQQLNPLDTEIYHV
jgi:hypothetical protein